MDMDDPDLIPAQHVLRQPLGTFTQTRTGHPDEVWRPLGGELEQGGPKRLGSLDDREQADAPHALAADQIRAALRSPA